MSKVVQFRRSTAILTLVAASLGGGLIAAFAVASHSSPAPLFVQASSTGPTASLPDSFADVISRVTPAVVNISSTRIIKAGEQMQNNPFLADPFFRQFFGRQFQPRDRREGSLGSGVIINADGYILTNNHVVDKATDVKVALLDHREFKAKVVGTDPQTDVAVLKINATNLPVVELGNSARARIGDLCFAIGNPFGVGQTVTMGIVSAKGRSLPRDGQEQTFEDFIQTDAAINPGNSGGALINARGELIGINTAILTGNNGMSGEGGNIGIGFAVPVNMARNVMEQLVKNGKVTRGYMGAYLQDIDANLAASLGMKNSSGTLIDSVEPGKPAEKAGLKQGDVITSIDGQPVDSANALTNRVVALAPGTTITLDGIRDGRPIQFHVTLGSRPTQNGEEEGASGVTGSSGSSTVLQGVQVDNLTPDIRQQLDLSAGTHGVVITSVDDSSAAADAGLQRGDVIQQVNHQAVNNKADFDRLIKESGNKQVLLLVNRQGRTFFTAIESK